MTLQALTRRQLEDYRRVLARIAGEAAGFVRDRFGLFEMARIEKSGERDETLKIDVLVEDYVLELLKAEGLKGIVLTEERGLVKLGEDNLTIVLDPLDGSKNFISLVPWASVSLALAPCTGCSLRDIVAGAVAPLFEWPVISFARGLGVYEGEGKPTKPPIKRLLLHYVEDVEQARVIETMIKTLKSHGLKVSARALGSASLEILWAAFDRAYAFMDLRGKLRNIDIAASIHAAVEAGAKVIVEYMDVGLERVQEVGVVIVSPRDTWPLVEKVLRETGYEHLLSKLVEG